MDPYKSVISHFFKRGIKKTQDVYDLPTLNFGLFSEGPGGETILTCRLPRDRDKNLFKTAD